MDTNEYRSPTPNGYRSHFFRDRARPQTEIRVHLCVCCEVVIRVVELACLRYG